MGSNKLLCYFSHLPKKGFLVSDSYRGVVQNGSSISVNVKEVILEND